MTSPQGREGSGRRTTRPGPAVDCNQEKEVRIPQGWGGGSRRSPPPQVCPVSPVHSFSLVAVSTPLDPHRWGPSEWGSRSWKLSSRVGSKEAGRWEGSWWGEGQPRHEARRPSLSRVSGRLLTFLSTPSPCSAQDVKACGQSLHHKPRVGQDTCPLSCICPSLLSLEQPLPYPRCCQDGPQGDSSFSSSAEASHYLSRG